MSWCKKNLKIPVLCQSVKDTDPCLFNDPAEMGVGVWARVAAAAAQVQVEGWGATGDDSLEYLALNVFHDQLTCVFFHFQW